MVASQFSRPDGTTLLKPVRTHKFPAVKAPDAFSYIEDIDFSDVFGPVIPVQVHESACDEPAVIHRRSHSFVGPTSCANQLSNLTLREGEGDLLRIIEEIIAEAEEGVIEETNLEAGANSVGLEDFEVLKLVGQGAFGKVYQVRKKSTSEIFAMKVMRKDNIVKKKHAGYMIEERNIMTKIDHPYIVRLRYSFQTKYRLYLVLDFVNGGHLFFQLHNQGLFREDLARVYTAEIVSAVAHLHANGIMHRDLKPENILLDAEGHAMLTDFGLAKQFDEKTRSNSICGTMEYMAPEIVLGKAHDKAADWWSLGILLYEMLTGKPPLSCVNRHKFQQKILKDKIKLPSYLTSEAHSLLKGLLQKEVSKRLGSGPKGSDEIKGHKWFKPINWKKLEAREIVPSFLPQVAGKSCTANFDERWTKMPLLDSPVSSPKFDRNPFEGFSYVRPRSPFQKA